MTPYSSTGPHESGVNGYEIGEGYIRVRFTNAAVYTYSVSLNGHATINRMISLALASRGLSTFIAQNKETLKFE